MNIELRTVSKPQFTSYYINKPDGPVSMKSCHKNIVHILSTGLNHSRIQLQIVTKKATFWP